MAAYDVLGLDDWSYDAVECDEAALLETLRRLDDEGRAGVSLTMPLKRAVLPLLARSDRLVADVGAANTVLFGGQQAEWWGANTDVPGMVSALRRRDGAAAPAKVCVLGGGATATSALAAMRDLGVVASVVVARRPDAVGDLLGAADRLGVAVDVLPWDDGPGVAAAADLVVSTTPAGSTDRLTAELGRVRDGAVLFDVVYSPWPTVFATRWSELGGSVIGGLELLVEQAALQVRLMTGQDPPVDAMRAAGLAALASQT